MDKNFYNVSFQLAMDDSVDEEILTKAFEEELRIFLERLVKRVNVEEIDMFQPLLKRNQGPFYA